MVKTDSAGMQAGAEFDNVRTTLYELIAALNEDVLPDEDWVVTDAVLELFETGQAKFLAATELVRKKTFIYHTDKKNHEVRA
jgi:hypothetical protein